MPKDEVEKKVAEDGSNLSDIEIAELANKELRKKEEELSKLRKELAQAKLYSTAEEEEEAHMSFEDCTKVIFDNHTNAYDYAEAVVGIIDSEIEKGNTSPFGAYGLQVGQFFKDVIDECDGDKSRFISIYQSRLGADEPSVAMAYNKRNNK